MRCDAVYNVVTIKLQSANNILSNNLGSLIAHNFVHCFSCSFSPSIHIAFGYVALSIQFVYNDVPQHAHIMYDCFLDYLWFCELCPQIYRETGLCQCQTSNCRCIDNSSNFGSATDFILMNLWKYTIYFDFDIYRSFSSINIGRGWSARFSISHFSAKWAIASQDDSHNQYFHILFLRRGQHCCKNTHISKRKFKASEMHSAYFQNKFIVFSARNEYTKTASPFWSYRNRWIYVSNAFEWNVVRQSFGQAFRKRGWCLHKRSHNNITCVQVISHHVLKTLWAKLKINGTPKRTLF